MGFKVGNLNLGDGKTIVIAEAGVNHLRDFELAERIISEASKAGADIVKFQTYSAEGLTVKDAPRFWKWDGEHDKDGSQFDSYDRLATPEYEFNLFLRDKCREYGVEFMSTPFDNHAVEVLESLDVSAYKIASGDITNFLLLDSVAKTKKPIFISTGAASVSEIRAAVNRLERNGVKDICIMHCTLCYPTRKEDANIRAIGSLARDFPNYPIGFSDHTIGPLIPAMSVSFGCVAIEKHYTVDKTLPDSADHWLSIDTQDLEIMVKNLRTVEAALGDFSKSVIKSEEPARKNARRSLVVKSDLKKGHIIKYDDLLAKRPSDGISPNNIDEIIGMTLANDKREDDILYPDDIVEDATFKRIMPDVLNLGKDI
jgi:N,N'-diacetyllegionaminate synthase